MIMKLQSNFTTIEQGKRLLELGLPANSADLIRIPDAITDNEYIMVRNEEEPIGELIKNEPDITPCWSVGRLIEILITCGDDADIMYFNHKGVTIIEHTIDYIDMYVKRFMLDFSKLEQNEITE